MLKFHKFACFAVLLGHAIVSNAQAFVNFDFENVKTNTSTLVPWMVIDETQYFVGRGPTSDLAPGWTISVEGYLHEEISLNLQFLASVYDRPAFEKQWWPRLSLKPAADGGNYLLAFNHSEWKSYELRQRGDIPADAEIIQINGGNLGVGGSFSAFIDGTGIVDGDISKFAGKNVELKVVSNWVDPVLSAGIPVAYIDSIELTAPKEPEPIRLKIERFGQTIVISWNGGGTLTSSSTVNGEFTPMIKGTTTPYFLGLEGTMMFYRVENQGEE